MSFIFISYSRQDQAYVSLLVQAIKTHSLPVWLDDHIAYGAEWPREIQRRLDAAKVFVLVMSPRSRESPWVGNELTRPIRLRKPIFPLWLDGDIWFEVESYQAVDVREKNLPPARFFDTLRTYLPSSIDTAQTLPLQAVATDTPVGWAPPTTPSAISQTAPEDDLSSEKGIDYRNLRDLLKAGKWREADTETYETMIRAVGKEPGDYFTHDELLNFPCADLLTIDRLWVKYSNGKFGFSVQKKIWQECGSPTSSGKAWDKFCVRVGWQDTNATRYLKYDELKADPRNSPEGEFPRRVWLKGFVGVFALRWVSSLASRLVNCSR